MSRFAPRRPPRASDALLALGSGFLLHLAALSVFMGGGRDVPLWLLTAAGQAGFLGAVVAVIAARGLDVRESLWLRSPGWRRGALVVVGTLGLDLGLVGMEAVLEEILRAAGLDFAEQLEEFGRSVEEGFERAPMAMAFTVVLLPAVCEEALFRGVALAGFSRSFGPARAVLASSALFGLVHVLPLRVALTFLVGLYAGACVILTRSLWCGVIVHGLNDAAALALMSGSTGTAAPPVGAAAAGAILCAAAVSLLWKLRVAPSDRAS